MGWQGWPRVKLRISAGENTQGDPQFRAGKETSPGSEAEAIAPVIVSASRSTDIPAFYGDWFMERLREGYAKWINPWSGVPVYVSFAQTRLFVFWSKNPAPFLPNLSEISRQGYQYYFLFTLNDYEAEGMEPHIPPLDERIETFRSLSRRIGKEKVVWRWDPLLLTPRLDVKGLLERIRNVGDAIAPCTERMVISFIDIAKYPRVAGNLLKSGSGGVREFTPGEEGDLIAGLAGLNRSWKFRISACGEKRDFSMLGIGKGQCISYDLMARVFGEDTALSRFLGLHDTPTLKGEETLQTPGSLRDPGQRPACGCVVSKDIGQYGTCPHLCLYCYANPSPQTVRRRYGIYRERAERGIFGDAISE